MWKVGHDPDLKISFNELHSVNDHGHHVFDFSVEANKKVMASWHKNGLFHDIDYSYVIFWCIFELLSVTFKSAQILLIFFWRLSS